VEREIADLSARNVELGVREAQLRVDQSRVTALLPLADRWSREAGQSVARFDTVAAKGIVTSQTQNQALFSRFDAASKLAELKGQAEVLESEVPDVVRSRSRAEGALAQLVALYDGGSVRSPVGGVVGPRVPDVGHVAKTGDELMVVYRRDTYVLAYLPRYYMFRIARGDKVQVSGGSGTPSVTGVVESVLSVADALPEEFQVASRPRDRDRLLRISLPKSHGFALSQKLEISGCAFGWCWGS
jgi:multidrug resistance efflux pump